MKSEIPVPIMFSPIKHHLHFLQKEIKIWRGLTWEEVLENLLQVGNNLIDFYTGSLTVDQICREALEYFEQKDLLNHEAFLVWIQPSKWKKIQLSDGSEWLIKIGNDARRYIHIHPAKYSEYSIRVRATTLKTVLVLQIQEIRPKKHAKTDLENVNTTRKKLLDLSPIKSLHSPDSGILRLWLLFHETAEDY